MMTIRKPNRATTKCVRSHRRPMPQAPRSRWDDDPAARETTRPLPGDSAPIEWQLAVRRYGLGTASQMFTDGGGLR